MSTLLQNPAWAALVALLVKATALVCVAATAQLLLGHRASAATRHGVWALTVAGLLLLPPMALTGPQWPVQIDMPASQPAVARAEPTPSTPATVSAATSARGDVPSTATAATAPGAATDRGAGISWPAIALAVYAAGVLLLSVRLVADHLAARRLVRASERILDEEWTTVVDAAARALGVTKPVRLLRAPAQAMPMVVGLRRPAILVSNDADAWTAERRRSVILHEMAHVQRRDCFTQTLASLARAVYWPHPGVWWAARRLQVEREFACDDRVLALGTEANGYANDLLEIAYSLGARRAPALAVTMARRGQLEGRLLAVLDAARNRATPGLIGRAAAALVAAGVIVPVAAIGIRTEAAALPIEGNIGVSSAATGRLDELATPAHRKDSPRQPARLAPALYSWTDVVEQGFSTSGTWSVQPSERSGEVYFEMRQLHSSNGHNVPLSQLEGLTTAQMNAGGTVKFLLRRDAGTFTCEGVFREGGGGGAFTYAANPAFSDELAKRGVTRPTAQQQFEMASNDVSLALVDDLRAQGYQTPTSEDLVQAGHHGVSGRYVRDMGALGYKVGTIGALINMRDHGVSPDFVQGMLAEGLPKLSAEDLVRARDHGVTPDYVRALRSLGYGSLTLDALVNARDHGVSADYVTRMRDLGFKLTLDELIAARDHGVSTDYVKGMSDLGYKLTIDELRSARDHGVTPDYVRAMQGLGYKASLDELVTARDHGVTPEYVRGLKDLGYSQLSIEELRTLRDHGATPERVKRANDKAGTKLSPEMLRTVLDGGLR
jgi:beta-lactamase regulating signal transducer with metallopeptidase domain